jgi:multiple sugar transport system substrate-binding protein
MNLPVRFLVVIKSIEIGMTMLKHRFAIHLSLVIALFLASCTSDSLSFVDSTADNRSVEPVTITFGAQEFERQFYQPYIDRFEDENPYIRVQFVALDSIYEAQSAYFDMTQVAYQVASAADTAFSWSVYPEAVGRGYYKDLKPFIDVDQKFEKADFYPGALESAMFGDNMFIIPITMRFSLLYYNKDLWSTYNLPHPSHDWTWEDIINAAEQLSTVSNETGQKVSGLASYGGLVPLMAELKQQNSRFTWGKSGESKIDQPEVVTALEKVVNLQKTGTLFIPKSVDGGEVINRAIMDQKVGMWFSDLRWNDPNNPPSFDIGVAVLPPSCQLFSRSVHGYTMSSGTKHPEESWRWLSFLSKQWISTSANRTEVETLPARRSSAELSGYWDALNEEARKTVQATLEQDIDWKVLRFEIQLIEALSTAVSSAIDGNASVSDALQKAQIAYDDAVGELPLTPTPKNMVGLPIVATARTRIDQNTHKTQLTIYSEQDNAYVHNMVERYNNEHSDVFVTLKSGGSNIGSPEQFDIYLGSNLAATLEMGMTVLDLQPLMEADPNFKRDDYHSGVMAQFARNGSQYGLPRTISPLMLLYNGSRFDEVGLSRPNSEWTMTDFTTASGQLSDGQDYFGYAENSVFTLQFFLKQEGIDLSFLDDYNDTPRINSPEVVSVTREYISFVRDSVLDRSMSGYTPHLWADVGDAWKYGNVAMWINHSVNAEYISRGVSFELGVTPPPKSTSGNRFLYYSSDAFFISSRTEHIQEAWDYIAWASNQTDVDTGRFPARKSLAMTREFINSSIFGMEEVYEIYYDYLDAERVDLDGGIEVDLYWYYKAVERAILRPESLDSELDHAQHLTLQHIKCIQTGLEVSNCARQVDSEYNGFN